MIVHVLLYETVMHSSKYYNIKTLLIINTLMEHILLYLPASSCCMSRLDGIIQETKYKMIIMTLTTKTTETMKLIYSTQTEAVTWRSLHHSV